MNCKVSKKPSFKNLIETGSPMMEKINNNKGNIMADSNYGKVFGHNTSTREGRAASRAANFDQSF